MEFNLSVWLISSLFGGTSYYSAFFSVMPWLSLITIKIGQRQTHLCLWGGCGFECFKVITAALIALIQGCRDVLTTPHCSYAVLWRLEEKMRWGKAYFVKVSYISEISRSLANMSLICCARFLFLLL